MAAVVNEEETSPAVSNTCHLTEKKEAPAVSSEELISTGYAPIKREYLNTNPSVPALSKNDTSYSDEKIGKKSKRQLKRERKIDNAQEKLLCSFVAMNRASKCPYGDSCRLSHDVESFMAGKPEDLPGSCPFSDKPYKCPYGFSCRYLSSHTSEGKDDVEGELADRKGKDDEVNFLSKDTQQQIWKKSLSLPRSDAVLLSLGLLNKYREAESQKLAAGTTKQQNKAAGENGGELASTLEKAPEPAPEQSPERPDADQSQPKKPRTDRSPQEASGRYGDAGVVGDGEELFLPLREKKIVDFRGKIYLAPLTTVGNLPFRRVCKDFGVDITCGEMAMSVNLLQGQASEWALLRRHISESTFGVQICGAHPDQLARTVELIEQQCSVDFIDVNVGCPIDIVVARGGGSHLLTRPLRLQQCIRAAARSSLAPLTMKVRMGYVDGKPTVHSLMRDLPSWGLTAVTIHGRSRQQRYTKTADWGYIQECASLARDSPQLQVLGNGDVFSYTDWNAHLNHLETNIASCMVARGALIKPWLATEIKEQRHWDISAGERLDMLKDFVRYGLCHWGSDTKGVETTRTFLLEWLGYLHRYIPVELLEVIPQRMNWRPPRYYARSDLESLMASDAPSDWVLLSEMLLGPTPPNFKFAPKHKSNSYDKPQNG